MSDGQLLLIALAAFTFYECLRWVSARAWIFKALGAGIWRTARPWQLFRTRGGGAVMLTPLPPMEAHVVTSAWPCAPHEAGLCIWHEENCAARYVPWSDVKARADGPKLHVTAELSVRCIHAASAEAWATQAKAWTGQSQKEREASFLESAAATLDEKALESSAELLEKSTRWLRRIADLIFFACFFILPVIYWRFADAWPLFAMAAVLLALMFTQAVLVARMALREPRLRRGMWAHTLSAALFPPSSMRAADWICATCSPEAHPLAALKAWRTPEELQSAAATYWREARWPIGHSSDLPWDGPEVEALAKFIKTHGFNADALESPGVLPEGCTRWCPRCLTAYREPATECADCTGIKLVS